MGSTMGSKLQTLKSRNLRQTALANRNRNEYQEHLGAHTEISWHSLPARNRGATEDLADDPAFGGDDESNRALQALN